MEVAHPDGRRVDLHPVRFAADGSGVQPGLDGAEFRYPATGFGAGRIAGRRVPCLTATRQLAFREGYAWRPVDHHDVALLREHQLAELVRSALGRTVTGTERLAAGSRKGAFRLRLDDGGSVVGYVWAASEDWWSGVREPETGPFADATGLELFAVAHAGLTAAGVRTMELLLLDRDAGVALVEDLPDDSLEDLIERGEAGPALHGLAGMLRAMAAVRGPRCGKVLGPGHDEPFAALVLERALRHLDSAAGREPRVAAVREDIGAALRERAAAVTERDGYCLVHGELGPDHVRIDRAGRPVLIDIESVMLADAEWEHAFLELRFDADYPVLHADGLDEARLRLYRLATYLSLVEGPLRLLETDFPDRKLMRDIAEDNLARLLATIG